MDPEATTSPPGSDETPSPPDSDPQGLGRWSRLGLASLPILVLLLVLAAIRIPYFVLEPGQAQDVAPLIHISGHPTFQSQGHLMMTDVSFFQPNTYEAIAAWVNPHDHIVREDELLAPGQNTGQYIQQGLSQMDASKIDATVVALTHQVGYPKNHGPGALIESVLTDAPATNKLFPGDLVTKVNGKTVENVGQVSAAIKGAGYGGTVIFTVEAGGKTRTVRVTPGHVRYEVSPGQFQTIPGPAIGVSMVANFPFDVTISSQGIGGPSAGLMWALGITDQLTQDDLTGGRTIAGTGEIAINGDVLPIGGVQQKVVAAERAHATVFFVPIANADDAASVAQGIRIVPVKTYSDALTWLEQHPTGTSAGG
jgi:PDZ domain-containing protein